MRFCTNKKNALLKTNNKEPCNFIDSPTCAHSQTTVGQLGLSGCLQAQEGGPAGDQVLKRHSLPLTI